jgi:RNA polymerase sigma-70 factor (ECF subfamily)
MSSVVSLNSKAVGFEERPNRCLEGRVEDWEGIYEELIAPMESRMMRSIWRVVRNSELAEDTLQDALATIWKKIQIVLRHPNPQALILKICLNAACDSLRKRSLHHEEISTLNNRPGPSDQGAMRTLVAKEMEDEVLQAIGRLPRKQALAVLMRVMQEESFDVIARTLRCSEVTARGHVAKGRARLQQWLAHLNPAAGKEASDEYRPTE